MTKEDILQNIQLQQAVYSPTDIINITKEQLKTVGALIVVEGVYVQCGTKDYRGVWYDAVKSQYAPHRLTAITGRSFSSAGRRWRSCMAVISS